MNLKKVISKLRLKPFPNYQLVYIVAFLILFHMNGFIYDNDFWFSINQGRYILEHSFPTVAINSIHNISFIYQSWGSGTLFYIIHNYLGMYGIIFLLIVVSSLTMYFFYKLCFVVSNNKHGSLINTIIAFELYGYFVVTRPQIFTVLNLVIILYLLESYIKTDNSKYLFWLPLISLLQINFHGIYFIVLLIIILPYLINSFKFQFLKIKSEGYRKKPLFIAYLCMILTGFLNPYGYKTIIYGFSSYSASSLFNNTIIELRALDFHCYTDKVFILSIIVAIVLHFCKIKKMSLRYTLLLLGTSYLAFDAIKSYYLFLFCSLFPLTLIYKNNDSRNIDSEYSKTYHLLHFALTITACAFIILSINKPEDPKIISLIDYLDSVVTNKEDIKLFTDFEDGSYAEYRGYNCYLDPRGEIFLFTNNKKEDIYKEFDDLDNLLINYRDFIDKYQFDYMLVKNNSTLGYLMKDNSYKYEDVMHNNSHILYKMREEG